MVDRAYYRARTIIQERSDALVRIAETLLKREAQALRPDAGRRVPGLGERPAPA